MKVIRKKWSVLGEISKNKKNSDDVVKVLLQNRGLKTDKQIFEFLNPPHPDQLSLKVLGISEEQISTSIDRIDMAVKKGEEIVIYGDYDADGICASAILWETIYKFTSKITPYIPDRFLEGYGINPSSIEKIKKEHPKVGLIITVDNGIVAFDAISRASELNVDVIITDHHQKDKKIPKAYSVIHTDKISGSGVAWIFSREIRKRISHGKFQPQVDSGIGLASIGTIADQLPLVGPNRSIAKFGLVDLNETKRPGLLALYQESGINLGSTGNKFTSIGAHEVNYVIAPRINAMGRLKHAIDSLRLICTKDKSRSVELAHHIGYTNKERQKIVDEVLIKAKVEAAKVSENSAIVISGKYHEGVIGLAAGKLVEEYGRPAIVFAEGNATSKASARSIDGFNIIDEIKKLNGILIGSGGHPMAAGLSIKTDDIPKFKKMFQENSNKLLTEELLTKTLKIDLVLEFGQINFDLLSKINQLKPFGRGNYSPIFETTKVKIIDLKKIGSDLRHMKMIVRKGDFSFEAIMFNFINEINLLKNSYIDLVYSIDENNWNGNKSLQLNVKDLKLAT